MLNQHSHRRRSIAFVPAIAPLVRPTVSVFPQTKDDVELLLWSELRIEFNDLFFGVELLEKFLGGNRPSSQIFEGIGLASRAFACPPTV